MTCEILNKKEKRHGILLLESGQLLGSVKVQLIDGMKAL